MLGVNRFEGVVEELAACEISEELTIGSSERSVKLLSEEEDDISMKVRTRPIKIRGLAYHVALFVPLVRWLLLMYPMKDFQPPEKYLWKDLWN